MLGPIIEELADQYAGKAIITKCDVDSNGGLAQTFEIMSIPAVKLFVNGEVVREQVGVASKDVYENAINQVL
jgi:thioredoxin 1